MRELDHKIVGYFSYRARTEAVLCHGDACIIAETEKLIESYEKDMMLDTVQNITKKPDSARSSKGLNWVLLMPLIEGLMLNSSLLLNNMGLMICLNQMPFFPKRRR